MAEPIIVLGPGQGAQRVGMARAWCEASDAARAVVERADAILGDGLGAPLSAIMFDGPEARLNATDVSQPAIYTASVACWAGLRQRLGEPPIAAAAGLSLGEYTALHLAGCFDFETGLRLVATRGRLMQAAAEAAPGGMIAVVGAEDAAAEALCREAAGDDVLVPANYNAPGQVVLSGGIDACRRAAEAGQAAGYRATLLAVAGAFHSPLMQPAADAMARALAEVEIAPPACPVWSNVTAERHDAGDTELLRRRLVEQIVSPVRWAQTCAALAAETKIEVHELAPGAVLRGLMRRIDRSVKVQSHDEP